jgi:SpoVK/Ycf46/Vps4 family AAA+-type ATPase
LARKLSQRYTWDDLVLPDDQVTRLRELVQMVRGRAQVLDAWGLGEKLASSYGITALFAGSPGTGKTMAAEVLARDLGLDVYKIDLSGLVSKYIGETEKNLERVFSEAESSNAILFFDEADAVFGKRSEVKDAHDRYANIETSYLLQRMEAYDGVTILATNLRSNLDEAFTRRLDVIVDFPFPDAAQRANIWKALFPSGAPRGEDVDLELMARRFKVAGGSIRNILVAAAYLAAANDSSLDMSHLLHATRREMQKLGRLTDERDFTV